MHCGIEYTIGHDCPLDPRNKEPKSTKKQKATTSKESEESE